MEKASNSKIEDILLSIKGLEVTLEYIANDIKNIKEEDREQNKLLAEHILGVKTNSLRLDQEIENREKLTTTVLGHLANHTALVNEHNVRLAAIEEIPKALKLNKRIMIGLASILSAITIITNTFKDLWPWN